MKVSNCDYIVLHCNTLSLRSPCTKLHTCFFTVSNYKLLIETLQYPAILHQYWLNQWLSLPDLSVCLSLSFNTTLIKSVTIRPAFLSINSIYTIIPSYLYYHIVDRIIGNLEFCSRDPFHVLQ